VNRSHVTFIFLLTAVLLAGCRIGSEEEDQGRLKLMSSFDKMSFNAYYGGSQFEASYPNYEVEYVNTTDHIGIFGASWGWDRFKSLLQSEKPDVIAVSSPDVYFKLIDEGLLQDMSTLARKDEFTLDAVHPAVASQLKSPNASHELYGLAPFFNPEALYVNKTLFERFKVKLPEGELTWEEMLETASQFPGKDENDQRIYGFHFRAYSTPGFYMDYLSDLEGLRLIHDDKLTVDQPAWRKIIERLLHAVKRNALSFASHSGAVGNDPEAAGEEPFLQGRVAMFQANAAFIEMLNKRQVPFEWQVVPRIASSDRRMNAQPWPSPVYVMYRDAENSAAAWKYIRHMNDSATLKLLSKSVPQLPSHTDVIAERFGENLEPFYVMKSNPVNMADFYKPLTVSPFFRSEKLHPIIDEAFGLLLEGKLDLDETVAYIKDKGQAAYDLAREEFKAEAGQG